MGYAVRMLKEELQVANKINFSSPSTASKVLLTKFVIAEAYVANFSAKSTNLLTALMGSQMTLIGVLSHVTPVLN